MHDMKKSRRPTPILNPWKGQRSSGRVEFYHYPTAMAERFLYYATSIGRAKCPKGFRYEHSNENGFLLHFLHQGELWHRVRNKEFRLGKGRACLLDLSEPVEYGNDRPQTAVLSWVLFNGKDLPHLITELRADREFLFDCMDVGRLSGIHRELMKVISREPPGHELRIFSILVELLVLLFESRADHALAVNLVGRTEVLSEPVRKGIDFMVRFHGYHRKNENKFPSLGMISDAVGLSKYHFLRRFHREMGITPMQYLTRYRIQQAARLLKHSNKSIGQIAPMVGIPDQQRFSRLFRKIMGITPRDHRKAKGPTAARRHVVPLGDGYSRPDIDRKLIHAEH